MEMYLVHTSLSSLRKVLCQYHSSAMITDGNIHGAPLYVGYCIYHGIFMSLQIIPWYMSNVSWFLRYMAKDPW